MYLFLSDNNYLMTHYYVVFKYSYEIIIIIYEKNNLNQLTLEYTELHLCGGVRFPQRVSSNDSKQSDGEVAVMLELWGMRSTPLLPLLPGPPLTGVVAPDRVLSIGRIELFDI